MNDTSMVCARTLGIANYDARWIYKSNLVKLTATGLLPCSNYTAELEQRPENILPAMWDMVFYTQLYCQKAIKPFHLEVTIYGAKTDGFYYGLRCGRTARGANQAGSGGGRPGGTA